jgi:hypothetical protein
MSEKQENDSSEIESYYRLNYSRIKNGALFYDKIANSVVIGYFIVAWIMILHVAALFYNNNPVLNVIGISLTMAALTSAYFGECISIATFYKHNDVKRAISIGHKFLMPQTPLNLISFICWICSILL